ncbi:MAG: methyltransferase domain-containing protein [Actinobacteria bacterium]|nr:methyltransferase domain-containing protein [Actinomycetota bacterium]MBU1942609.1 methyltransferase domain-containing protein [Actinomycetota bacterium]MBU2688715.1 methyltransferase domain-containing protein [Actinomycetota bacterium]
MGVFDPVSGDYRAKSVVQRKAADRLMDLLDLKPGKSVLDVGCGPGHITAELARRTGGRVVGADISEGMIEKARSSHPGMEFRCVAAEDLDYEEEFDVVFCNSTLQWFGNAVGAISAMYQALARPGRLGVCCPATPDFAPWFNTMVARAGERADLAPTWAHWCNPWFQLPGLDQYRTLFERCGFATTHAAIEVETSEHTVEEAYGIYITGAARGFVDGAAYDVEIGDDYVEAFNRAVREEMETDARDGLVTVSFNRLYYIGLKK